MKTVEHQDRAHALLSASGAHRWMHCTPSARLEAQFPDSSSEAAKEGTLAHEIAEAKTLNYFNPEEYNKEWLNKRLAELKVGELYSPEMDGFTDAYRDYCRASALEWENAPHVGVEQKLDLSTFVPGGFGTADCIMIGDQKLRVIDLKYGKGVPVEAEANPQLMLYALGAYEHYKMLYDIQEVEISIFQPRIDNTSSWKMHLSTLLDFGGVVRERAALAIKGKGDATPGNWCRFCRARAQCRARAEKNVAFAFKSHDSPELMTLDEIGGYLERGEDVARWLKDLQEYALSQCLAGHEVAGWKAVEGRGSRDWTDQEKAFRRLEEHGIDEAMLYERKPLSLAQTEKLVGKKDFADTVGDLVVKKPGKPTLVPESDKRTAITNVTTAAEAFKN
ncbi:DUF2800 domain-containing protein [Eubacterium pyruvativorans]|uniref:DUF2800 domain-containing protein n=1 Tax=Eubacterium pyruvativorans TaxID=155865 RepID=UPI0008819F5A|nr:DUF2800 domain-containing protein [Eubacterium pyruvativorans]SDF31505.1 Protein of unknown function [Eubacterium pyruvativorans]